MEGLNDYREQFLPGLKPQDFSHDALVELLGVYSQLYMGIDGFWYLNGHALEALEKEGGGRESQICRMVEPQVFKGYASFFNPRIETKPLKLPPRKRKDGICCQWEFKLEDQGL